MNAYVLKLVALVTMLIDHVGYVFVNDNPLMRSIGRIAFPLYALMVVDACLHLNEEKAGLKKYLNFLLVFSILSEPFYDYAFKGQLVLWRHGNQILQFLTFVVAFAICQKLSNAWSQRLVWLGTIAINEYFCIGYYSSGIIIMLCFMWYLKNYQGKSLQWKLAVITGIISFFIIYFISSWIFITYKVGIYMKALRYFFIVDPDYVLIATLSAVPFLALYNGDYGVPSASFKNFYKWFYPAHLAMISLIKITTSM